MKTHRIALIGGDGIGPEVLDSAVQGLERIAHSHNFTLKMTSFPFGGGHYLKTGEILSAQSEEKLQKFDAIFLGAVGHPNVKPGIIESGLLLHLRFAFDQYINLRPVRLYPGIETPLKNKGSREINYTVVRENTGGLYCGAGGITRQGFEDECASQTALYTYSQVERTLRYAFETASKTERKTLALVGKSNVLTHIFSLWLRLFEQIGENYPMVKREYYHVDAAAMFMISAPEKYDVIVTSNTFGDILTDIGAVTQGGLGMAGSGNINPEHKFPSMFEPVHGSAPDIAGQNKANPIGAWISARMMLDFLGEAEAAHALDQAIVHTTQSGINGLSTTQITAKLLSFMA